MAINGGQKTLDDSVKTKWPIITEDDKRAVMDVLDSGIIWGVGAPEVQKLEKDFAKFVGTKHCIAVNSGTAALHCSVTSAGIGPGDEVITTAYSFIASAVSILHNNAIPIFIDIDPDNYNIDVNKIEEKITCNTKAIMPVHIFGLPAEMDPIKKLAGKYGLTVIEDACQSHGSIYKGKKTGSIGDIGVFSLNTTKNLPGGEGGLITTDSEELADRCRRFRMFGESSGKEERKYQSSSLGWNYRTQEMPAAFSRSQLKRLDMYNNNSNNNADILKKGLGSIKGIRFQEIAEYSFSCYHRFMIRLDRDEFELDRENAHIFREQVRLALIAEGVDATLWQTRPLPGQPVFKKFLGYGKGCPWNCGHANKDYSYKGEDYPETMKIIQDSIVIGSPVYPIYAISEKVTGLYLDAFYKVFTNLDEVKKIIIKD